MKRAQPSCSRCSGLSVACRSSNPAKGGGCGPSLRSGLSAGVTKSSGWKITSRASPAFERVHRDGLGREPPDGEEGDGVGASRVEGPVERSYFGCSWRRRSPSSCTMAGSGVGGGW